MCSVAPKRMVERSDERLRQPRVQSSGRDNIPTDGVAGRDKSPFVGISRDILRGHAKHRPGTQEGAVKQASCCFASFRLISLGAADFLPFFRRRASRSTGTLPRASVRLRTLGWERGGHSESWVLNTTMHHMRTNDPHRSALARTCPQFPAEGLGLESQKADSRRAATEKEICGPLPSRKDTVLSGQFGMAAGRGFS